MNAPNRVEELRKRYHENPKRYFAPLANEYRKTGFVDRAILLCEKHLAEQPGNMNGLVVYGQCLFESGRVADAAAPFEEALGLDPENLIALRHLGDIARLGGDAPAARGWYERVLELDRRNEEVLELIEQVGGRESREPSSGPSAARNIVSVAPSVRVAGRDDAFNMGNIELGDAPSAPAAEPPAPAAPAAAAASAAAAARVEVPTAVRPSARALPPDSTAKTLEIPDPSRADRPKRRASLLDIAFDFGEGAPGDAGTGPVKSTPTAPARTPEPERPRTSIATPKPGRVVGVLADYIAEKSDRIPSGELLETVPPPVPPEEPVDSLIDTPDEPISLDDLPMVPGLLATDFSREVNPLPDLEATEFQSGLVQGIDGLESMEFSAEPESLMGEAAPAAFEGGLLERAEDVGGLPPLPEEEPRSRDDDAFESVALGELPMEDDHALPPSPDVDIELPADEDGETVHGSLSDTPRTFVTETMAQLYLKQGFRERAISVYRQLIEQDPDDAALRERLAALEASEPPSLGFELPEEVAEDEDAPPPNAMLADVSFADVALQTPPEPPRSPTPPVAAASAPTAGTPAGPTAREFLRAFARRALTPAASSALAAGAPAEPGSASQRSMGSALDALFAGGVLAEDERAAHRLAGVGATSGPSGGSALDSLFGEGPSAPAPRATPRASDRIRFDRFFTPAESAPAAPASAEAAEAADGAADEPADEAPSAPSAEPGSADDEGGPDDDLDQFQGWLRGLTP